MTTRLAEDDTRFLQFNRRRDNGAGNPDHPSSHRTSYLWETIWQRDVWMDILARFVHVGLTAKELQGSRDIIFP